jgi:lipid-binding SYLF domain-containing protein
MKNFAVPVLIGLFLLSGVLAIQAVPALGQTDRMEAATRVFNAALGGIPAPVLKGAQGIAIIPGEVKAGFIFGGELGQGVLVARDSKRSWSPPAFISVAGASFGLQIGGEARDIVLVFNTPMSVAAIENGTLNLGGDVSVVAGPAGGDVAVGTPIPAVYSYVRSSGAFIGATVQGTALSLDVGANRDFYGVSDPLRMAARAIPEPARRFTCSLSRATGSRSKFCS